MKQNKGMQVEQDYFSPLSALDISVRFKVRGVLVTSSLGTSWEVTQRIKPHLLVTEEERCRSHGTQLEIQF